MEDRVDENAVVCSLVENLKGEPTNRHMPKLIDCDGKDVGMTPNRQYARFDASSEFFAESRFSTFRPVLGLDHISIGIGSVDDVFNHAASEPAA